MLGELSTERLGDVLSVTQPVWEGGLDLRDFRKLMTLSLEKNVWRQKDVGHRTGPPGTPMGWEYAVLRTVLGPMRKN